MKNPQYKTRIVRTDLFLKKLSVLSLIFMVISMMILIPFLAYPELIKFFNSEEKLLYILVGVSIFGIISITVFIVTFIIVVNRHFKPERQPFEKQSYRPRLIPLTSNDMIMLDSSILLDAIGYGEPANIPLLRYLKKNTDRIIISTTVKKEIHGLYDKALPEARTNLKIFDKCYNNIVCMQKDQKIIDKIYKSALDDPSGIEARNWMWSKRNVLEKPNDSSMQVRNGVFSGKKGKHIREKCLKKLYDDAKSDILIVTEAVTLSHENNTVLLTNDGDILIFVEKLEKQTSRRLRIGDWNQISHNV